jgi:hypothetical protein
MLLYCSSLHSYVSIIDVLEVVQQQCRSISANPACTVEPPPVAAQPTAMLIALVSSETLEASMWTWIWYRTVVNIKIARCGARTFVVGVKLPDLNGDCFTTFVH